MAEIKKTVKASRKKEVVAGVAHVDSTFNNTVITITDTQGNTVAWSSCGLKGFKGARKSTPYAAEMLTKNILKEAQNY